jgi:hypothetical protein
MERQDKLVSAFAESMPSIERLISASAKDMDKICANLKRQLSALTTKLSRTLPKTRELVALVEDNVPLFIAEYKSYPPHLREIAGGMVVAIDAVSGFAYAKAEYIQNFKKAIELMRDGKGVGVRSEAVALIEVLDEMVALYNRHWFSCQDMVANLRAQL